MYFLIILISLKLESNPPPGEEGLGVGTVVNNLKLWSHQWYASDPFVKLNLSLN